MGSLKGSLNMSDCGRRGMQQMQLRLIQGGRALAHDSAK